MYEVVTKSPSEDEDQETGEEFIEEEVRLEEKSLLASDAAEDESRTETHGKNKEYAAWKKALNLQDAGHNACKHRRKVPGL